MLFMFKNGLSAEALAKVLIFKGFSQGLWTPDLGLLLAKPVMYMLLGIAKRAGVKVKVTHVDRSPLKHLVNLKQMQMSTSNPETDDIPEAFKARMSGLMAREE
jgi:hypothetical protein